MFPEHNLGWQSTISNHERGWGGGGGRKRREERKREEQILITALGGARALLEYGKAHYLGLPKAHMVLPKRQGLIVRENSVQGQACSQNDGSNFVLKFVCFSHVSVCIPCALWGYCLFWVFFFPLSFNFLYESP